MSIQAKKDIAPFNEVASLKNFSHNKINSNADPLLNKADLRSKFALENAGVGIWEWDISTDELIWSSVMFTLYGYDSHQKKNMILRQPNSIRPWQFVLEPLRGCLDLTLKLLKKKILDSCKYT